MQLQENFKLRIFEISYAHAYVAHTKYFAQYSEGTQTFKKGHQQ